MTRTQALNIAEKASEDAIHARATITQAAAVFQATYHALMNEDTEESHAGSTDPQPAGSVAGGHA
jgi:hypothetical protein